MSQLSPEQRFLLEEARQVWEERESAKNASLPWQEETITDIFIKNVKLGYPGPVEVIPFNKTLEGESGADWIWSFTNSDGSQSMTMLIQAKRLHDDETQYPQIDRNIGKRVPPVRQIDQLIAIATQYQISALYAFYNHLSDTSRIPRSCMSLARRDNDHIFGFGISIADAEDVAVALPDQSFDTHCLHSVPLHCLLCTRGKGSNGPAGSPEAIVAALHMHRKARRRAGRDASDTPDVLGLTSGDHPIVERAREIAPLLKEGVPLSRLDLPNVAGVIVFHDGEDGGPIIESIKRRPRD